MHGSHEALIELQGCRGGASVELGFWGEAYGGVKVMNTMGCGRCIYVFFMCILCMYMFFDIHHMCIYFIVYMIKEKFLWISLTFSFWKVSCSCKDRSLNWRWLYELCFAHVHNGFGWFVRSLHFAEHKLRKMWMKSSWCNQCCNHMELLGCFGFVWFWCFFRLTVIM